MMWIVWEEDDQPIIGNVSGKIIKPKERLIQELEQIVRLSHATF